MDRQPRGESRSDRPRRGARRRALLALGLIALATSCRANPAKITGGIDGGTGGGGGGTSGSPLSIVGSWRRTVIVMTGTLDYTSSETMWTFVADDTCRRLVVTTTLSAGFPDSVMTACTYALGTNDVTIVLADASQPATFTVYVHGDTLELGGVPFVRVG